MGSAVYTNFVLTIDSTVGASLLAKLLTIYLKPKLATAEN
jgi:hypothetical protein